MNLYNVACAYSHIGETEKALDALERSMGKGMAELEWMQNDSDLDNLREHPRFKKLLAQAGGKITIFDFGGPLSFGAAADVGHQVRERVKDKTAAIIESLRLNLQPIVLTSVTTAIGFVVRAAATCSLPQVSRLCPRSRHGVFCFS